MNLWSLDGIGNQLGLADDEMVQVIIDDFVYTPSGETHVPEGGSCVKDCQCASLDCDNGTCASSSSSSTTGDATTTKATTTSTDATTSTTTTSTTTTSSTADEEPPSTSSPMCVAHPECAALGHVHGNCCPVSIGLSVL